MNKITNNDINNNINSIITIGNVVLWIFIIIAVIYFGVGIYYVNETDQAGYFLTYSILYPLIYTAIGIAIRILLKWAAYLLKTVLDIKNSLSKNKKEK